MGDTARQLSPSFFVAVDTAREPPHVSNPVPILSPCIGICELGAQGLCVGCWRTGDEIAAWSAFSPSQRDYLMQFVLPQREGLHHRV